MASITLHFGRKGQGKTYWAKRVIETQPRPCAVWDPNGEFAGPREKDPPQRRRLLVRDWTQYLRLQSTRTQPLAPVLAFKLPRASFGAWATFFRRCGRGQLLVIDEAQLVAAPNQLHPDLLELTSRCRHLDLAVLLAAQRARQVDPSIRSQADIVRAWHTTLRLDVKALEEDFGSEFARNVQAPQPLHAFSEWNA